MTVEELMRPRYKVIADYPHAAYEVGAIINFIDDTARMTFTYCSDEYGHHTLENRFPAEGFQKYPAIFRPLQWWENRKPEDMPLYVKRVKSDRTIEVLRVLDPVHNMRAWGHEPDTIEHRFVYPHGEGYQPATEEEYKNYVASKRPS